MIPNEKPFIRLTDKQREWLKSLTREDMYQYHYVVEYVLASDGFKYEETRRNLNKLVEKYKNDRNGKNSINR